MIEAKAKKTTASRSLFNGQSTEDRAREPDLVTAFFDVMVQRRPELAGVRGDLEPFVRHQLHGMRGTVTSRPDKESLARQMGALFNGRNHREVARLLGVSSRTVYRRLKQSGREG